MVFCDSSPRWPRQVPFNFSVFLVGRNEHALKSIRVTLELPQSQLHIGIRDRMLLLCDQCCEDSESAWALPWVYCIRLCILGCRLGQGGSCCWDSLFMEGREGWIRSLGKPTAAWTLQLTCGVPQQVPKLSPACVTWETGSLHHSPHKGFCYSPNPFLHYPFCYWGEDLTCPFIAC